ncbi:uncharacterized protein [Amphiura filiformis]|uniref:uncharacterized protein n=1 Tax=Amphiura filiformis TaxID=82378 RepID=UPI003B21AF46
MTKIQVFLHILVIIVSALATCTCGEDTNFVFSIPYSKFYVTPEEPSHVLISTSSLVPINTTLTIPGAQYQVNNTISRDHPVDITLSIDEVGIDIRLNSGDPKNKTVHVQTSGESSVFVLGNEYAGGDAYLIYSTSQLGTQYYIASYKPINDPRFPSFFCISSVYPNTSINITTPTEQPRQISLAQFESYRFDDVDEDLSGTFVQSNKPIAVISGVLTRAPEDKCCLDVLIEQLPPVHSWGYQFTLTPFLSLNSGYLYRVFTTIYSATLYMSDGSTTHIPTESLYEEDVTGDTVVSFTSDQPVMVVQYMKGTFANTPPRGDPSMLIVTPITSFTANVTFPVFEYANTSTNTYYINVIIECDYFDGVLLNETPFMSSDVLHTSDNSTCCLRSNVSAGYYTVSHAYPMAKLSVIVYAVGESGGERAGLFFSYAYAANPLGFAGEHLIISQKVTI